MKQRCRKSGIGRIFFEDFIDIFCFAASARGNYRNFHRIMCEMGDYEQSRQIEWLGNTYTVEVSFKADPALPIVEDGSQRFYDNRISLRIVRKDGTEFFSKTFTKADFEPYLNSDYGRDGALLGIVFDRIAAGQLVFAASVGSPDKSSDEFIPLVMKISRFGEVSIREDSQLDVNMREGSSDPIAAEDDDDGV